jgi:hypothetical protein
MGFDLRVVYLVGTSPAEAMGIDSITQGVLQVMPPDMSNLGPDAAVRLLGAVGLRVNVWHMETIRRLAALGATPALQWDTKATRLEPAALQALAAGGTDCAACGKPAGLLCARCGSRRYCSRQCQERDWPVHKENGGCPKAARLSTHEMLFYNSDLCVSAREAELLAAAVREGCARAPLPDAAVTDLVMRFASFCDVAAAALGFCVA